MRLDLCSLRRRLWDIVRTVGWDHTAAIRIVVDHTAVGRIAVDHILQCCRFGYTVVGNTVHTVVHRILAVLRLRSLNRIIAGWLSCLH